VQLEIIVVDDSAEGSARSAVASVDDPRVHYELRTEPSGGRPARVRNDGASLARGRYLYFLDDDDLLFPDTLSTMMRALDAAPDAGMAFGVILPFGADELRLHQQQAYFVNARRLAAKLRTAHQLSASLIFCPAVLVNSACMARRSVFENVGGFDAGIPVCEDADLWARIADATGFVFIDQPVVNYRTGATSLMHNLADGDAKLHVSYRYMQQKYRQAHGALKFLAMKLWARAFFH